MLILLILLIMLLCFMIGLAINKPNTDQEKLSNSYYQALGYTQCSQDTKEAIFYLYNNNLPITINEGDRWVYYEPVYQSG